MRYCRTCRRHHALDRRVCPGDGSPLQRLPDEPPRPGDWLDNRYALDAHVASGGTSNVFLAYDLERDETCALKVLRPDLAAVPTMVRHFFDEAAITRSIRHPGVIPTREAALSDTGHFYQAMDFHAADRLDALLDTRRCLTYDEVIVLARELLGILRAVHAEGIVHLDVKPENLFVARDRILLFDFGSAVRIGAVEDGSVPLFGTPEYMAPEWILRRDASPAADLYALGIVLFECLTGSLPFQAADPVDVLHQHVHHPFPIERLRGSLPRTFQGRFLWFLASLVEKQRERRTASAMDAMRLLEDNLVVVPAPLAEDWHVDEVPLGQWLEPDPRALPRVPPDVAPNVVAQEVVLAHVCLTSRDPLTAREGLDPFVVAWKEEVEAEGGQVVMDAGDELRVLYGWGLTPDPERILVHLERLAEGARKARMKPWLPAFSIKVGVAMGRIHYDPDAEEGPVDALDGSPVGVARRLAGLVPESGVAVNRRFHDQVEQAVASRLLSRIPVRERLEQEEVYQLLDRRRRPPGRLDEQMASVA